LKGKQIMQTKGWGKRGPCPECNSSDANVQHSDGYSHCFSCDTHFNNGDIKIEPTVVPMRATNFSDDEGKFLALTDRKISFDTAKFYGVKSKTEGTIITQHSYPYHDKEGTVVGNKFRKTATKEFWSKGDIENSGLFGQHLFPAGSAKFITVCEGEIDAMSTYEMNGSKYPCVSVKNGAQSAKKSCQQNLEYLNTFKTVVLCFDNDKPGKKAASEVAALFEPNKCKIVSLNLKDANEYLKTGQRQKFVADWWAAAPYTPAGILNLAELGDTLYDESHYETCLYPWSGLNDKTYGIRTGELVCFTSGAGMGKSSIMRELMHHIMGNAKDNIGVLALEESVRNTALNIMSVEANARLYIKEIRDEFSMDQLREFQSKTINTGRFFAFDHFGSISNDEILDRVRHMAKAMECKWIFLDHLSILVSGQEDNGDERKSIDILMTKLRSLVEETNIALLLVSHLRRPSGDRGHEDGREVSLSHLRGSASIAHLSDSVIALERNQQAEDDAEANTTTLRVLKNRYTGDTGIACHLHYDKETGRMTQIDNPFMENE
tara:strand:+ start:129 stop:1772 length:1644 start_codon:yes stop_codon:yes gene_type:complete